MRRRWLGRVMLCVGAASLAAPIHSSRAEETGRVFALRPSLEPASDLSPPAAAPASPGQPPPARLAAPRGGADAPSARLAMPPAAGEDGAAPLHDWIDAARLDSFVTLPADPARFQRPNLGDDASPAFTDVLQYGLRREAGGNPLVEYQYLVEAAHLPGWVGAASALDALRRQENATWRQNAFWNARSGWEFEHSPTDATWLGARGYYSPGFNKSLMEAKFGLAFFDGAAFAAFPALRFYAGPYVGADGPRFDGATKLGAHLTIGQIGVFHLTFAAGYAHDRWGGPGAFGLIQSSLRF